MTRNEKGRRKGRRQYRDKNAQAEQIRKGREEERKKYKVVKLMMKVDMWGKKGDG